MTKISREQIEEILDEQWGILITRDPNHEGVVRVATIQNDGRELSVLVVEQVAGTDLGDLVDELHARL